MNDKRPNIRYGYGGMPNKKIPFAFLAAIAGWKAKPKDTYYKGERETTNGLSEQMIFEIKQDFHCGKTVQQMAIKYGKSIEQISYAVELNEAIA